MPRCPASAASARDVDDQEIGPFTPTLISKHEQRFTGFDDRIIPMYARGMSVRETRAFEAETIACRNRPLETMYPCGVLRHAAAQEPGRRRSQQRGGVPGATRKTCIDALPSPKGSLGIPNIEYGTCLNAPYREAVTLPAARRIRLSRCPSCRFSSPAARSTA